MAKLTGGKGWSLSSDEPAKPQKKENPKSPKPKIRLEYRMGKTITVISGLHTYGAEKLERMAREFKTLCGAGGTVKNGMIEIQGDQLEIVQNWFKSKTAGPA